MSGNASCRNPRSQNFYNQHNNPSGQTDRDRPAPNTLIGVLVLLALGTPSGLQVVGEGAVEIVVQGGVLVLLLLTWGWRARRGFTNLPWCEPEASDKGSAPSLRQSSVAVPGLERAPSPFATWYSPAFPLYPITIPTIQKLSNFASLPGGGTRRKRTDANIRCLPH